MSDLGKLVAAAWLEIPDHHSDVVVDAFAVMPDHIHGILGVFNAGTAGCAPTENANGTAGCAPMRNGDNAERGFGHVERNTLPVIVRLFKASVSRQAKLLGYQGVWQRGYFEHVIRHSQDYESTCGYIATNVARWSAEKQEGNDTR